jgi:hypothetical protein
MLSSSNATLWLESYDACASTLVWRPVAFSNPIRFHYLSSHGQVIAEYDPATEQLSTGIGSETGLAQSLPASPCETIRSLMRRAFN